MTAGFIILAVITIVSAVAAMSLRNLVHCALALAISFAGFAAIFLRLDAQFVGFAQILVYVGAVAILIVFAILLTRGSEPPLQSIFSSNALTGAAIALLVFAVMAGVIHRSTVLAKKPLPIVTVTVRQIGDQLMTRYVLPMEVIGLLLTAALIGAVIIAMREKAE
jgi:NADH-quinone oxidoreductase subunit J